MAPEKVSNYRLNDLLTLKAAVQLIKSRTKSNETVVRSRIAYHRKIGNLKSYRHNKFKIQDLAAWADAQKGWKGLFDGLPTKVTADATFSWNISLTPPEGTAHCSIPGNPVATELLAENSTLRTRIRKLEAEIAELQPDATKWREFKVKSARRPSKNK